jgi:hypothetical protein
MNKQETTAPADSDTSLRFNLSIEIDDGPFGRLIRDKAAEVEATPETAPDTLKLTYPANFAIYPAAPSATAPSGQIVAQVDTHAITVITRFFAVDNGIGFTLGSQSFHIPFPGSAEELTELHELLKSRDAVQKVSNKTTGPTQPTKRVPKRRATVLTLPITSLKFFNDPVHGATVRALARVADWKPCDGFSHALQQVYADANITIGLPDGQTVPGLWDYLRDGGARRVKAHYALWARYYEHECENPKLRFAIVSVPQFCADLGLKKHKNGGYRPEQKREAMKLLHALASVEMRLEKTLPSGKRMRIKGAIWLRGAEAEEKDQYADLFGQAREGEPARWEPSGFSFMPGQFYDNPEWRQYHRYIGKVGAGLLRLDNREEWAILIGGYLATLARIEMYRPIRLKIGTILKAVGLAQSQDAQNRAAVWQERLWRALDALAAPEIGVVVSWRLDAVDTSGDPAETDSDDAAAWAAYGQREIYPPGDWRNWIIEITFPFEVEGAKLQAAQVKAIEGKKRATARKAAQRAQKCKREEA